MPLMLSMKQLIALQTKKKIPKTVVARPASLLEARIASDLDKLGIEYVREHKFHPTRKWRFDFFIPACLVAIEAQGGTRNNGGHNRHAGYENDCRKFAEAAILGITVLAFTSDQIKSGEAIDTIKRLLQSRNHLWNNGGAS